MIELLCVEDDPLVRAYLATRLSLEADLRVTAVVPDAGAALQVLSERTFDVVILDYRLEGADGLQLLGALRSSEQAPRVLFYTGLGDGEFQDRARELGAAGVVNKSSRNGELLSAVRSVAEGGTWFQTQ
jgi:DNA-binding NarL/FixJ family response regulator